MKLKVYPESENYTAQIIRLQSVQILVGLDRLVGANIFGSLCLIGKDYPVGELYVYLPAGTTLSPDLLSKNNLYRDNLLNSDINQKGYFDSNARVKSIKFAKGLHVSTGILVKLEALQKIGIDISEFAEGQEFNEIDGIFVCQKYVVPIRAQNQQAKQNKILDNVIDSKMFREHDSTLHFLKFIKVLNLHDLIITIKLHGTSCRIARTKINRILPWYEKILQKLGIKIQQTEDAYLTGSRHVVKSINFQTLRGKQHFYSNDLWTRVAKEYFENKLHIGEEIFFEIIGSDNGKAIQPGYSYGFNTPQVYIYRIAQINDEGIFTDLNWSQIKHRAIELGVNIVPELWYGPLEKYFQIHNLIYDDNFKETLATFLQHKYLEKKALLDDSVIEEGLAIRVEGYPKSHFYKLKSPSFINHESNLADKNISNIEDNS